MTLTAGRAGAQATTDKVTAAGLAPLLTGMGYDPKPLGTEAGKEKFEVAIVDEKFTIPVAFEVSPSGRYIWLTVNLGPEKPTLKARDLLKQNFEIQPSQFYITGKGNLMVAIGIENRGVTPALVKWNIEKVVKDVSSSSELWSG